MSTLPTPIDGDRPPLKLFDDTDGRPIVPDESGTNTGGKPATGCPLSETNFDQLSQMSRLARPVEKAIRYANFSGWTTLLAGALSLPFALHKAPMLVFCMVLAGIGTRELTLRRRLMQLDMCAPKKLAMNQLLLGGALIAYAVFMLASTPGKGMVETAMQSDPMMQSNPELGGMMDDLVQLERFATAMIYVGVIVMAIVVQGGTALYYRLKGRRLQMLHKQTPAWAVRVYQTVHG